MRKEVAAALAVLAVGAVAVVGTSIVRGVNSIAVEAPPAAEVPIPPDTRVLDAIDRVRQKDYISSGTTSSLSVRPQPQRGGSVQAMEMAGRCFLMVVAPNGVGLQYEAPPVACE